MLIGSGRDCQLNEWLVSEALASHLNDLLESIEALFSMLAPVHVFLDNALSSPPGSHSVGRAGIARPARVPDQAAHELAE